MRFVQATSHLLAELEEEPLLDQVVYLPGRQGTWDQSLGQTGHISLEISSVIWQQRGGIFQESPHCAPQRCLWGHLEEEGAG